MLNGWLQVLGFLQKHTAALSEKGESTHKAHLAGNSIYMDRAFLRRHVLPAQELVNPVHACIKRIKFDSASRTRKGRNESDLPLLGQMYTPRTQSITL